MDLAWVTWLSNKPTTVVKDFKVKFSTVFVEGGGKNHIIVQSNCGILVFGYPLLLLLSGAKL